MCEINSFAVLVIVVIINALSLWYRDAYYSL